MTGPSSNPRGEKPGRPGAAWETVLIQPNGQQYANDDDPQPRANRATRREARRAARRRKDNR